MSLSNVSHQFDGTVEYVNFEFVCICRRRLCVCVCVSCVVYMDSFAILDWLVCSTPNDNSEKYQYVAHASVYICSALLPLPKDDIKESATQDIIYTDSHLHGNLLDQLRVCGYGK